MVLTFALFGAVFSSLIWLVYAIKFISTSLGDMSFFDAGLLNVLLYTLFVCLPEFIIWMIFSFLSQYFSNKFIGRQMYKLFSQMKKNQEYSDLLARIMLETGENIRNSFMMNHFELLIADMNESLSEIIQREKLADKEQIKDLWAKIQNGGKWAFGKILVENYNKNPDLKKKIFEDASSDNILSGTVMEFCARYQTLIGLLEKYDKEKVFLNIIETGVYGKVFSVMASVSDDLRRLRDMGNTTEIEETKAEDEEEIPAQFLSNFSSGKKGLPKIRSKVRDEFSLALERSFASEDKTEEKKETKEKSEDDDVAVEHKEPVFTDKHEEKTLNEEEIPDSQKALDNLKKEWQKIEIKQESSEEDLAYPFGGWTDVDKYQK
ncbi:MAG: hypothetical protein IKA30_03125 [Alphaproteobacteria bacterium]|nr:hypothetical protein [Alphaproteobacteria bacterium]